MSDILSPQGFETAEALQDTDIQEVYQPTSGGIRRNKQVTLAALKAFFRRLTTFTANNIVESDGTGNLRTTSITTASVASAISNTASNTNTIAANINQGVKSTDSPIFAGGTIAGHDVDAELSQLRIDVNGNDSDISSLQTRATNIETKTPQSYKTTDNVVFNGVNTDNVIVKHKKFTGTVGADDIVTVTHGLTASKILGVSCQFLDSNGRWIDSSNITTNNPKFVITSSTLFYFFYSATSGFPFRMLLTYEA